MQEDAKDNTTGTLTYIGYDRLGSNNSLSLSDKVREDIREILVNHILSTSNISRSALVRNTTNIQRIFHGTPRRSATGDSYMTKQIIRYNIKIDVTIEEATLIDDFEMYLTKP